MPGERIDALIVGAGFAGLYALHRLRSDGLRCRVIEAADGVGGTWYWNRYPGARCDIESMQYSYQFSEELQADWDWSERYASQPELLAYIEHVTDRFGLRGDIEFSTQVESAAFVEASGRWQVRTDRGTEFDAQFLVLGVGCLSTTHTPQFEGMSDFGGRVLHTGRWPHDGVDFAGQRVGVIGTGSSAIQSIPLIAEEAERLVVFQRTPNYVVPARNRPLSDQDRNEIRRDYRGFRRRAKQRPSAFLFPFHTDSALEVSAADRRQRYDEQWEIGGLPFLGAFGDLLTSKAANDTVVEYWQAKVREVVDDPEVAERLIPKGDIFGCKRLCAGTNYYETYNRANVRLVDCSATGITRFTPEGLEAAGESFELDVVVCATGFDAMTGSVTRLDLRGKGGQRIQDKWSAGPLNYLGLAVAGFPNMFYLAGPGSPSVFATMVTGIEHQVDWLADCLRWMRQQGWATIEATPPAESAWVGEVNDVASKTLRSTCNSWYLGSNIPGKPRVFMPYIGGFPTYVEICDTVASTGYEGFAVAA